MNRKRGWITGLLSLVLVIGYACQDESYSVSPESDQALSPEIIEGKVSSLAGQSMNGRTQRNFRTHLSGAMSAHTVYNIYYRVVSGAREMWGSLETSPHLWIIINQG